MPLSQETKRHTGEAQAAGGAGLSLAVPLVSRTEKKVIGTRLKHHDKKIARAEAKIPYRSPRGGAPIHEPMPGRRNARFSAKTKRVSADVPRYPHNQAQREKLRLQRKAGYRAVQQLKQARKGIAKPRVYPHQAKLWTAAVAAGVPISYFGARRAVKSREQVGKKMDQKDVNAAYVGGAGAGIGYQGGAMLTKPIDWHNEKKIRSSPKLRRRLAAHEAKYPRAGLHAGDTKYREFFANYPKNLPGGRMKRAFAHTHTGKTGGLATLGVIGGGAAGAVALNRKHDQKQALKKNLDPRVSAFGIEH